MANDAVPGLGQIGWIDLTVPDAVSVRDFYQAVTGWTPSAVQMGDYNDYCMNTPEGQTIAGVCHKRGQNADQPSVWMVYIVVADLDESIRQCEALGGKILRPAKDMGGGSRFCVIQDPAGAVAALYQVGSPQA
jgi:uncharacterized protein